MLASTILYIFVFLIFLAIFIEYINAKRSQTKRREERKETTPYKPTPKKPTEPIKETAEKEKAEAEAKVAEERAKAEAKAKAEKEAAEKEKAEAEAKVAEERAKVEAKAKAEKEASEKEKAEAAEEVKELPSCEYPPFTHVRLVEMGLSDDEAIEFVNELIPQLEEQVPLIENAINSADFHKIEKLTHGIKGSATNLGTGGVSDLLSEFNTYLKSEVDVDIVKAYHAHFIHYIEELKKQYTQGNL